MVSRRRLEVRRVKRWGKAALLALVISFMTLEFASMIAIEVGLIAADKPNYLIPGLRPFWINSNPHFGVWHEPNTEYVHTKSCFSVTYRTNSYGARDRMRQSHGEASRVVVIGDSFVEGYGLNREDRTTDILEASSGIQHLNFGTSGHFGPTQSFLLYKHLAKRFYHNIVLFGFLPDNDFTDDDPAHASSYPRQYRPYYVRKGDNYKLDYVNVKQRGFLERDIRRERRRFFNRALRNFTYAANAINYLLQFYRLNAIRFKDGRVVSASTYSGYYDFTKPQAERLIYVLEQMLIEAEGKTFIVFVIPRPADMQSAPAPLLSILDFLAEEHQNLHIVDLRKSFARQENWVDFYRECDGHWSPAGANAAAEALLADPIYRQSLGLD